MVRAALLASLLLPALASAQVTATEASDFAQGSDKIINIAECSGTVASRFTFSWNLSTVSGVTAVELRLSDTTDCPTDNSSAHTKTLGSTGRTVSGTTESFAAADLLRDIVACDAGSSKSLHVCAIGTGTGITTAQVQQGTVTFDGAKPSTVSGVSAETADSALVVRWSSASGANRYRVEATSQADQSVVKSDDVTGTSLRISRLVNETPYDVRVISISEGGNDGAASDPIVATPQEVQDFWRLYRNDGGADQGGCSTGGAGGLAGLALVPLLLRRRRRGLLAVLLLAAAAPAVAAESPRGGSFQLRISPYRPSVDKEFINGTQVPPYESAFGKDRHLMFRVEAAKALFTSYGSLEAGLGAGFFQASGHGRLRDGNVSGDTTKFRVIPTSVFLTYRFDVLANRYSIPLAPYARAGFDRYNWYVTKGSGGTADAGGRKGRGATNGYSWGGGVALLLDFLDWNLANEMDNDTGVNDTYLYVDAMKSVVDDFGSSRSMNLSPTNSWLFSAGLLFAF